MSCPQCEIEKRTRYNEQIKKARQDGEIFAKKNGLDRIYIVETINGIPGWREPGDESLSRLKTIDIHFITEVSAVY